MRGQRHHSKNAAATSIDLQRMRRVAAAAGAGFWEHNIASNELFVDTYWYQVVGIDPNVHPIRTLDDFKVFIHPEDVQRATEVAPEALSEYVRNGQRVQMQFRIIRPDGEVRWLKSTFYWYDFEGGRPRRIAGFTFDITEEQRAQEELQQNLDALREAEARLQELNSTLERNLEERQSTYERIWNHSFDVQVLLDAEGVVRAVNPAWTRVLGHQPAEVVGRRFMDFVLSEDTYWGSGDLPVSLQGKTAEPVQFCMRYENGAMRWIEWHAVEVDGGVHAFGRDLIVQIHATTALDAANVRLRNIFETSYQHQSLLSPDGLIMEVSAIALKTAGASREAVVGRYFWDAPWFVATPGMSDFMRLAVARCRSGEEVQHHDIELVLPGGNHLWFDFTLRPIRDDFGNIVALVHEAVDLTERRRTELALRQAQRAEVVGQLASGIAHDFKNLLQGIVLSLDVMEDLMMRGRLEEVGRFVQNARFSAERASSLLQRLLRFARQEPSRKQMVAIKALIDNFTDFLNHSLGTGIELEIVHNTEWLLVADPHELENVLLNLCLNARDAMDGVGKIRLETAELHLDAVQSEEWNLLPGDHVALTVTDHGKGMPPEVVKRAFDPFFTTKPDGKGTGLGLFMTYDFVQKAGGAIRIDSKEEQGSRMKLLLPRYLPEQR